jgi:nitrite reductase/ring-hydroxylating ferredoxin subunit
VTEFVEAARLEQVPVGKGRVFSVQDRQIAIFNVQGNIYAIGNSCAHAGASLGSGKLAGKYVTCPAHGMRYDVTTGEVATGGLRVPNYPVKVVDGAILIGIE